MVDAIIEVDRILELSLEELVLSERGLAAEAPQVEAWSVPEQDKRALSMYGLPSVRSDSLMGIIGNLQESERPDCDVGVKRLYLLGSYSNSRIGAIERSGEVFGIPSNMPVHPQLAHLYPDALELTSINSTILKFVECAWRWHALLPLLATEQSLAGAADVAAWKVGKSADLSVDPYLAYQKLCRHVLHAFQGIDPTIESDSSFWADVIIDVW
jgi:hypothetical protein